MPFIQTGILWALPALVAIPILIHLVFRQKAKRVDLGTLRFLREVIEQNARKRRVMRWLLLTLRLAVVVLLAFLFARPYLLGFKAAGEKQTVVVLIDQSATMEVKQDGVRLVDRAIAETKSLLGSAAENSRFEIAFFDHRLRPLATADAGEKKSAPPGASELLKVLAPPQVCSGGTDFGLAIEWARDVLAKAPPGPRSLHVYTDLQQSGLAWSEVDELPEDVVSRVHDLGRVALNNIAVTEARAERVWVRPREQTTLHVTVYNGGPFSADDLPVVVKLSRAGQKVELRDTVKLESGAAGSLRFDLPPLDEGLWQGTVAVTAEDDLAVDNARHVAILAARPYQVLLIDGRSSPAPRLAATYYLEAALRLAPPGELDASAVYEPRQITADDILPNLELFDAVVLADVGELDASDARTLARFVERGGGLLIFGGENVTPAKTQTLADAGLIPGTIQGIHQATDVPIRLGTWDVQHPIFAAFGDPQLGDLARLTCSAAVHIKPAKDAQVLASFRDRRPAVVEQAKGKGSIVFVATSADRQWTNWPASRLYLPLMHQFLAHQTGVAAGGRVRMAVLEGEALVEADDVAPGVHVRDGYTLVANGSPREAETDRGTIEDFANRFGLKLAAEEAVQVETPVTRAALGSTEMMDSEWWHWLACALLVGLVCEALVANRTAA